ncbi:MAG TPA: glycosyltransferase family 2 protein [Methanocorpusculum sp.]|nr:glycosyltransferase family 2 protein [Methanocorpusculum sp.]
MNISAVYVTYRPDMQYLAKSLERVLPQVQNVIVVDNSEGIDDQREVQMIASQRLIVLTQGSNLGMAAALNIGCKEAIRLGADWVLTLDQDSIVPESMVSEYATYIEENRSKKIGALGPMFKFCWQDVLPNDGCVVEAKALITSGCCINLQAFQKVGGFKENLFIDAVDTEYSWNLRKNGYQLFQFHTLVLEHHLGTHPFHVRVFGKRIMTITNHNALRYYYISRNSKKISDDYRDVFPNEASAYRKKGIKQTIMVLLFERNKIEKLYMIHRGTQDYRKGRMGRYGG